MREILQHLLQSLANGRDVAYCRLVETRGSTPQKAGAAMLVFPDGSQAGTLGGGCVEAEVKRRALAALMSGGAGVATFQLDHDYGWDDGLICGGRMQVLIEPLAGGAPPHYFQELCRVVHQGSGATEAVVFDAGNSGLAARTSYLLDEQEGLLATWQTRSEGGEVPPLIHQHLKPLTSRPGPYAAHGIGYLPLIPRCHLVIVGGGHIGKAVADLAAELEFDVRVIDDRGEYVTQERFPRAEQRISGKMDEVLRDLKITPHTYCLIVTRGHSHDKEALYHLAERDACYVGMIGSRRKIKMIFEDLLSEGISQEALSKVYAPVGIDIGSQTVLEIAVSICAELVAHRNRGGIVPGRPKPVPN